MVAALCSGCAQKNGATTVRFVFGDSSNFNVGASALTANDVSLKYGISALDNSLCYAVHVTASDLYQYQETPECSDDTSPHGLGLVSGMYKYGDDAVVTVKEGTARRFDLVGFRKVVRKDLIKDPQDIPNGLTDDCPQNLHGEVVEVTDSGSGTVRKTVKLFSGTTELKLQSLLIASGTTDIVAGTNTVSLAFARNADGSIGLPYGGDACHPDNTAPVAQSAAYAVSKDTPQTVVLNATDAQHNAVSYIVQSLPTHGTISGTPPNLTYMPTAGFVGTDTLVYSASDGLLTSSAATITFNVSQPASSHAPVADSQSLSILSGSPLAITLTGSDPDSDPLSFVILTNPSHGTITGTPPNLSYQSAAGYFGTDVLVYKTNDGTADSPPATISISVAAIKPTLVYSGGTVNVGNSFLLNPSVFNANGFPLSSCGIQPGSPNEAAFPPEFSINPLDCSISGVPANLMGTTVFTIAATNSGGTISATIALTVTAGFPALSYAGASGTGGHVGVAMSVTPTTLVGNGASIVACGIKAGSPNAALFPPSLSVNPTTCAITGTPTATLASTQFTLIANNGVTDSYQDGLVTLSVIPSPPVVSYAGSSGTSGTVGSPMSVSPTSVVTNGATITSCGSSPSLPIGLTLANGSCSISGTPTASSPATTYTITASNSAGPSSTTVSLKVNALPTISAAAPLAVPVQAPTPSQSFTVGDAETAAAALTLNATSSNTSIVTNANLLFSGSGPNRTLTMIPTTFWPGKTNISVTVSDADGGTALTAFDLTVIAQPISNGLAFTCMSSQQGDLKCWGYNSVYNTLGGALTTSAVYPDPAGVSSRINFGGLNVMQASAHANHSCALLQDHTVHCWGLNSNGELGDGTVVARPTPAGAVALSPGANQIATGYDFSCALLGSGAIQCWGHGNYGQLGQGSTSSAISPVNVSSVVGATYIAAGENHACAIDAGQLKCWGLNNQGQLGDNSTTNRTSPVIISGLGGAPVQLALGSTHSCVLFNDQSVKCWGGNGSGQLGDGSFTSRSSPGGSAIPANVLSIQAGQNHTCALLTNGNVQCWGDNSYGQLGIGSISAQNTPQTVVLGQPALSVSAGGGSTCAFLADNSVKCWGRNDNGQLGIGTTTPYETTPVLRNPLGSY